MDIISVALKRHSTKAFDPAKKLTADEAEKIKTLVMKFARTRARKESRLQRDAEKDKCDSSAYTVRLRRTIKPV